MFNSRLMCPSCGILPKSGNRCGHCHARFRVSPSRCAKPGCSRFHQQGDVNNVCKCEKCGGKWEPGMYTLGVYYPGKICNCPR